MYAIYTFYTTFTLEEIMKEEQNELTLYYKALAAAPDDRPNRNDFYTQKEFFKELKYWEIRNGLHKPTRRDFKDETELRAQLEIYNQAINRLKNT